MSRALGIMIPLSLSLAVICVLNIWTIVHAADCGDRQAKINGRCCDLCPPGKYMKEYCSEHQQTLCSPCGEGHYSDQYHIFDRCEKCQSCQQDYDKCTPTTNANCSCWSGFLCSNNICSNCEENKCVTGEKLKRTATSSGLTLIQYSYQCEPGHETHRSVGDFMHVSLSIGFVLLSLTLLVLLSYACTKNLRKHKAYNNPIEVAAVSTHTSDFHLSKEESGLKLIVQDESKKSHCFDQLQLEKVNAF